MDLDEEVLAAGGTTESKPGQQSGWATIRNHKLASQKIRREAGTDRLARKSGGGHPHLIVTTTRRLGVCPTGIVAITLLVRVSIAETGLEVELLTKDGLRWGELQSS